MSLSSEWLSAVENVNFNNRYFLVRHGQSEANVRQLVSSIYSVSVANHGLTELGVAQAQNAANIFTELAKEAMVDEDILGSKINKNAITSELCFTPSNLDNIIFYVSDFKRAYETGYYLKEGLLAQNEKEIQDHQKQQAQEQKQLHTPAFLPEATAKATTVETASQPKRPKMIPFYSTPALRERFFGVFEGACPSDDIYDRVWEQDSTKEPESTHFNVESIQSVVTRTTELILELEQIWSNKIIILVSHGDVTQIMLSVCAAVDPRFHRSLPHMNNCDVRELLFVNGNRNKENGNAGVKKNDGQESTGQETFESFIIDGLFGDESTAS